MGLNSSHPRRDSILCHYGYIGYIHRAHTGNVWYCCWSNLKKRIISGLEHLNHSSLISLMSLLSLCFFFQECQIQDIITVTKTEILETDKKLVLVWSLDLHGSIERIPKIIGPLLSLEKIVLFQKFILMLCVHCLQIVMTLLLKSRYKYML